jgi:hypothetical protein
MSVSGEGPPNQNQNQPPLPGRLLPLLEGITATVLLLVLASLGWILLAASQPAWVGWAAQEVQVVLLLVLLMVALLLVSIVALLHTRS